VDQTYRWNMPSLPAHNELIADHSGRGQRTWLGSAMAALSTSARASAKVNNITPSSFQSCIQCLWKHSYLTRLLCCCIQVVLSWDPPKVSKHLDQVQYVALSRRIEVDATENTTQILGPWVELEIDMSESGSMKRYAKFLRPPKDCEVLIMAFPRGQKDKSWSWASQTINIQGNQNKKPDAAAPIKKAAAKQQRAHKPVKKLVAKSAKGKGQQVCT
jgi:hypothetical protein